MLRRLLLQSPVLCMAPAIVRAQSPRDEFDLGPSGAMSIQELEREPVHVTLDQPYALTTNPRQRLDLYLPRERHRGPLPVIVYVHGGGWMHGDKADGAARLMDFVRGGYYAGVSVGYRLSGEAPWPAPLHDVKAAVRWVRGNADRLGLDPARIGVWGRGAGAHLALMLGTTANVSRLEGTLGEHRQHSSQVRAVANFFGPTDLSVLGRGADTPEGRLLGGAVRDRLALAREASPVAHASTATPPVLTVHGMLDRTVPFSQAARLDDALHKAGTKSYLVTIDGGAHGDFGSSADDRLGSLFDRELLGMDREVSVAPVIWAQR